VEGKPWAPESHAQGGKERKLRDSSCILPRYILSAPMPAFPGRVSRL